ncbi:MAG: hypothetical protein PW789_17990 [Edaphobacter sp.]|uniref:hypothetical protein n=1 Tax=Edaphobacter sp. TaxID=1934404 RepID=UPI0023887934|nr:hypothetical protein [Edaphobacter sp.]MDE1178468.1 hypothetical protein [Edaphobacter sp.]
MSNDMQTADKIAVASFLVSFIALAVAWHAIRQSNKNSSVATVLALNEAFRETWDRFFSSNEENRYKNFCELMNLFEIACGIVNEKSLSGMSKKMTTIYLKDLLKDLVEDPYTLEKIPSMLHSPTTFEQIKAFLKSEAAISERYDSS